MTRKVHSVGIYYIKNLLKIKKGYNIVELFFKRTNYIIQSEKPIIDLKYDILKHPNVSLSHDGNQSVYIHGNTNESIATINLDFSDIKKLVKEEKPSKKSILDDYDLVSSEDIDNYFKEKEGKNNEK